MKKIYRDRAKKKIQVETFRVRSSRALPSRAASALRSIEVVSDVFRRLFSDENFITLLEAESLTAIPSYLQPSFEEARHEHEIGE
jgi:hypothetical protein